MPSPNSPSSSAGTGLSTVTAISASPPRVVRLTWAPAMFTPAPPRAAAAGATTPRGAAPRGPGVVPPAPAGGGPDGAHHARAVGVDEEQQVGGEVQVDVEPVHL